MQLINTEYFRGNHANKENDKLLMVVKNEKGEKECKVIDSPKFTYYITLPEYQDGKSRNFIQADHVRRVDCAYMNLFKSIVEELKCPAISAQYRAALNGERKEIGNKLNRIHLDYRLHGTDMHIEDFYIYNFLEKYPYTENNFGLTKCFFDIEVDSSNITGFPEPEQALCPVNAICLVDIDNKKIHSLALSYEGEKSFDEFVPKLNEFKERIRKRYKEETHMDFDIDINIFDNEIYLIKYFFDLINNEIRPDFICAWNADFDIPYLINRIRNLGYDPIQICCPREFPKKQVYYKLDTNKQDPADKSSIYNISGYTNYLDLMCLYANITKPMGKEDSYSLDYIGGKVTGMHKDEVVENMKTFHFANFEKFLEYNIQDTVMLAMIEVKTLHIDLVYTVASITRTRLNKAMKKTICLKNLAKQYAVKQGCVQSNNRAAEFDRVEGKIAGALIK